MRNRIDSIIHEIRIVPVLLRILDDERLLGNQIVEIMHQISGQTIVEKIQGSGHPAVHWVNSDPGLITRLRDELHEGDVLLTLGAGDVGKIGKELFEALGSEK